MVAQRLISQEQVHDLNVDKYDYIFSPYDNVSHVFQPDIKSTIPQRKTDVHYFEDYRPKQTQRITTRQRLLCAMFPAANEQVS